MNTECTMGCEGLPAWDDELGDFCPVCTAALAAYVATLGTPPPQTFDRSLGTYNEQLRDAGRSHLINPDDDWR